MATDPNAGQPTDPGNETETAAPDVTAADLLAATEGNNIDTEGDLSAVADPNAQSGGSSDTSPEQTTPSAGGDSVVVPSAVGDTSPPTNPGNTGAGSPVTADESNEASPTGSANVAGTAASQLDLAPPMTDESGSNIPAPNLQQPVMTDALPDSAQASADALDPALVNPDEAAKARVEGRTSDAATRAEGTQIDEVPPDLNDGVKPSDGGPDRYPFPQGGDVDVATVPEYDEGQEYWPALTVEDVIILGEHDLIPERLVGRRAFIVDAPRYLVPVGEEDRVWVTVRTRDEVNATLTIPLSAGELIRGGRDTTVRG